MINYSNNFKILMLDCIKLDSLLQYTLPYISLFILYFSNANKTIQDENENIQE